MSRSIFAGALVLALLIAPPALAVEVDDFSFDPDPVTVAPGGSVQWSFLSTHTVTSDTGLFDSGTKSSGQTYGHTFSTPGAFAYHCAIHPSMQGTVRVLGITGRVLADSDGSGSITSADAGIDGVMVTLYDALEYEQNQAGAVPLDTAFTGADGRYVFDNDPSPGGGFAKVVAQRPGGYTTATEPAEFAVGAGTVNENKDFLFEGTGTVSGTVWNDVNGNGAHDSPEVGKAGVTVGLNGKRSTTTDANGDYSFAKAVPGSGTVAVTEPSGFASVGSSSRQINLVGPDYAATAQDFFLREQTASSGGTTTTTTTTGTDPGGAATGEPAPGAVTGGGTAGSDVLTGTDGADRIFGLAGADVIRALAGNDVIDGGPGNDTLDGGAGDDTLDGGAGDDSLEGGAGNDKLTGGRGNDKLDGGRGRDKLVGGAGRDNLIGGRGKDILSGGSGNDRVNAKDGVAEVVNCGTGRDRVKADRKDRLRGCEKRTR